MFRRLLLLLAPAPIISGSMALSMWAHTAPHASGVRNVCLRSDDLAQPSSWQLATDAPTNDLLLRCELLAPWQLRRLHGRAQVIVRAPFVICGDFTKAELEALYDETMRPAVRAMCRDYFVTSPDAPITVMVFSNESVYRDHALSLFGQTSVPVYGYYKPAGRTVVVNLETGRGTLCHELTHALMDFDFADAPIWMNEGLASFHEQCRVSHDAGGSIEPLLNWRLPILQDAIAAAALPSTWQFLHSRRLQGADEALNYAHARYFCYFLYDRGVLADFYARLRACHEHDSSGTHTLLEFFPGQSWPDVEGEFRDWVMSLPSA